MKSRSENRLINLIPLSFALGYIPLVVYIHEYDSGFEAFDWFPASEDGIMYDFFLYHKSVLIVLTAAVMLALAGYDLIKKRADIKTLFKNRVLYLPVFYLLFVVLSGILSPHPKEAFFGAPEIFEGVLVIGSYVVFLLYAALYVRDQDALKTVLKWAFPGLLAELLTAFSQIIKKDLLDTDLIKAVIIPSSLAELRESFIIKFEQGLSYGTLYNTNYVPQYAGFAFFITLSAALCSNLKKSYRAAALLSALLSFAMIIRADSRSGMTGFLAGLALYILIAAVSFISGKTKDKRKTVIIFSLSFAGLFLGFLTLFALRGGLKGLSSGDGALKDRVIRDVRTEEEGVTMDVNGALLTLSYEEDGEDFYLDLKDSEGKEPGRVLTEDGGGFRLTDPLYAGMEIRAVILDDRLCMEVNVDGRELIFSDFGEGRGYLYYNNAGKFSSFRKYERNTFFPDSLFTDRGLIWNHCMKLLPKTLFKGVGANAFVYAYPNDDDYFRLYDDNELDFYDVKAHSLYFQQVIENGLPAFVCFLLFCVLFFFRGLKGCLFDSPDRKDLGSLIRPAILAGFLCYMICGIANDSNVNTAPVFWILAGSAFI